MPTVPLKRKPKERDLLFVLNMTPVARDDYRVGVPRPCKLRLVLNSMDPIYGGYAPMNKTGYKSQRGDWDHRPYNVPVALPPYACLVFEIIETEPDPKELAEDAVNYVDAKVAEMAAAKAAEEEAKAAAEAAAKEAEEAKAAEADSACCCGASDENAAADCGCTADENESAACDCAADEKAVAEAPAKKAGKKSGKKLSRRARKALKK
ncbi:MAG: alpha amylase C-terminal domain-containing protein [Lachnospiraceae bacterium]|nr:alpha amylase C-terminal domain-containing protein [Lachnospiraceae bacterium]